MESGDALRDRVRAIVESFPEAQAIEVAGFHLRLAVRCKRFGWFMENHHGDGRLTIHCRALPGRQAERIASNPEIYYSPSYGGGRGEVGIWLDTGPVDWEEIRDLLFEAYLMTAPKKLRDAATRLPVEPSSQNR